MYIMLNVILNSAQTYNLLVIKLWSEMIQFRGVVSEIS